MFLMRPPPLLHRLLWEGCFLHGGLRFGAADKDLAAFRRRLFADGDRAPLRVLVVPEKGHQLALADAMARKMPNRSASASSLVNTSMALFSPSLAADR